MALSQGAVAGPLGGEVKAGLAEIVPGRSVTGVVQSSPRAVIDWRSLDLLPGEQLRIVQPSSQSILLNRVTEGGASRIDGQVTANGNVVVINPNGILFGPNARIDVGGLVASTSQIGNAPFMAGGPLVFDQPGAAGAGIRQQGQISAREAGLVALVAPHVRNDGLIEARLGRVHLGAGDRFSVSFDGGGLVNLALGAQHQGQLASADGVPVTSLIHQAGTVSAPGGRVLLMAAGDAGRVLDSVINVSGVVRAQTASRSQGEIVLAGGTGSGGGTVGVSGELSVAGVATGDAAGQIRVAGERLALSTGARLDAGSRLADGSATGTAGGVALEAATLTVGGAEADVLSYALRQGAAVAVKTTGDLTLDATIDGRAGRPGGALTLEAGGRLGHVAGRDPAKPWADVITDNGALQLKAGADVVIGPRSDQANAVDPVTGANVALPRLGAGEAAIDIVAGGNVRAYALETTGAVSVVSQRGYVDLLALLGYLKPLGALTVRAEYPYRVDASAQLNDGSLHPGDIRMMDVDAAGRVSLNAFRNIQLYGPIGLAFRNYKATALMAANRMSVHSTIMGDLPLARFANTRARYFTPKDESDDCWKTVSCLGNVPPPTVISPGTTSVLASPTDLVERNLVHAARLTELDPLRPLPPLASLGRHGRSAAAASPLNPAADAEAPEGGPAKTAEAADERPGEASPAPRPIRMPPDMSGRGVAQMADLGRSGFPARLTDVFALVLEPLAARAADLMPGVK